MKKRGCSRGRKKQCYTVMQYGAVITRLDSLAIWFWARTSSLLAGSKLTPTPRNIMPFSGDTSRCPFLTNNQGKPWNPPKPY
ncbi:unnamed protein product, partial [Linum tenue]